jgi:uncharacterized membrane protein
MRGEKHVLWRQTLEAFSWRNLSLDLKIIYLLLGFGIVGIFVPILNSSPIRIIYALPLVIFIPGYCLTAALFPNNKDIDRIERFALSIGLSIIIVPLIGLTLNFTEWGIQLIPVTFSIIIFSICTIQIALFRRFLEPEKERFHSYHDEFVEIHVGFSLSPNVPALARTINIIILVVLIAAIGVTLFAITNPKTGEEFTDFYILGENGKATDYPTDLTEGSSSLVIIGIHNSEYKTVPYVVEIWLTNMTINTTTNSTLMNQMERLDQFSVSLNHNETYQVYYQFTPTSTGFNQMTFLLFKDGVPSDLLNGNERINSSYRKLQLWVTVKPPV